MTSLLPLVGLRVGKSFLSQIRPDMFLFLLINLFMRAVLSAYSVHKISSFSPHSNLQGDAILAPLYI